MIHAELPESPETLTHRSGRTGRAGRKGLSIMLVPTTAHRYAESLLRGAGIFAELLPAPMAKASRERPRRARCSKSWAAKPTTVKTHKSWPPAC